MSESPKQIHIRLMATCPEYQSRINIYDTKFNDIKDHFKRSGRFSIMECYDVVESRIEELEEGEPERIQGELYELKRFYDYLEL